MAFFTQRKRNVLIFYENVTKFCCFEAQKKV